MTWNLSRACSPLIQIASRSPKLFPASPWFRTCPNGAGSRTSETWSSPRVLITPCSCLIATSLTSPASPALTVLCQSLLCLCSLWGGTCALRHSLMAKEAAQGGSGGISIASAAATCPLCCAWVGIQFLIMLFCVIFLWDFSPPSPRPKDEGEGLKKKSCCSNWKVHRKQKRLLEEHFYKFKLSATLEN